MTYYAQMVLVGTLGSRPTFGIAGRLYFATDTGFWYQDSGSAWVQLVPALGQYTYATLPMSPVVSQEAWVTDSPGNTWGYIIGNGGGPDAVRAEWNGFNWTVTGK